MPIRIKLTLAFTGVMAVLLAAAGIALSVLVASNLDSAIDDGLRARARDAAAAGRLASTGEPYRAAARADGRVVETTTGAGPAPLLSAGQLARARPGPVIVERGGAGCACWAAGSGGAGVLVVGVSLGQRERALDSLYTLLAIGGPLALLIASAVGYALAAAALRPVERMRRRAAEVTAAETSERLPVPAADDEIGRLGRTLNEMLARLEVAFKRERAFVARRLARAAHAARDPAHGARAGAARRAHARGARGRAALGRRGDRAAHAARRRPARDRALGSRPAPVRPEELQAGELLERVAGRFETRARAEGRPLEADAAPGVALRADPARLEQALANMVDNALTHGAGTVSLSARTANGTVELHVRTRGRASRPVPAAGLRTVHESRRGQNDPRHGPRPGHRRGDRRGPRRQRPRPQRPIRHGRLDRAARRAQLLHP